MKKNSPRHAVDDFAVEHDDELVEALTRIETLLAPHALERMRKGTFALSDEAARLSIARLRLLLQLEDHLDWLLRHDLPRLALWRLDSRRPDAIAFAAQVAEIWQALGVSLGRFALNHTDWIAQREHETLLPLTIAVALHCYVNEMRWRAQAEQKCDLPLKSLHRLYAIAEGKGIADEEVHPYEAAVDFAITPKGQYVLMLLMADLAERDLPPAQRLVAQHWLSRWAPDVILGHEYDAEKHSMEVNLDSPTGFGRIKQPAPPTARYLDIRAIAYRIEELDALLANSNGVDDTASEVSEADEEDLTETLAWLERLYHDRSSAFQTTRERSAVAEMRKIRVVAGWNAIQEFVDASSWTSKSGRGTFPPKFPAFGGAPSVGDASHLPEIDRAFAAGSAHRDEANFVQWRVRDTSSGGIGLASANPEDADLPVGTLLMVLVDEASGWTLGRIVRKFKDLDGVESRFGIQLLGHQAVPVRLAPRPPEHQTVNTVLTTVNALLLCEQEASGPQTLLLVSCGILATTRRFELKTGVKRLPLRTTLPVQSAGAWVLIRFEEETSG